MGCNAPIVQHNSHFLVVKEAGAQLAKMPQLLWGIDWQQACHTTAARSPPAAEHPAPTLLCGAPDWEYSHTGRHRASAGASAPAADALRRHRGVLLQAMPVHTQTQPQRLDAERCSQWARSSALLLQKSRAHMTDTLTMWQKGSQTLAYNAAAANARLAVAHAQDKGKRHKQAHRTQKS